MRVATLALLCALYGCSTSTQLPNISQSELEAEADRQIELAVSVSKERLQQVVSAGWPLLMHAVEICDRRVGPRFGFYLSDVRKIPIPSAMGLPFPGPSIGEEAKVWAVAPNSPANAAGIRVDDRIVSINGSATNTSKSIRGLLKRIEREDPWSPIDMAIKRGERSLDIRVEPVRACDSELLVDDQNYVNASASGRKISITTLMLEFVKSERELQFVIAHELAHNVESHIRKTALRMIPGGLVDAWFLLYYKYWTKGRVASFSVLPYGRQLEREADYVGTYILARADVELDDLENFWRRLATHNHNSIRFVWTHPPTAERALYITNTKAEIDAKRRAGKAVLPTRRNAR